MILLSNRQRIVLLASALLGMAVMASPAAHAATVVIVNNDGAGEGFNDPTAAAPVGGNTGTTVGAQRLIAFQRAADIWAARLSSSVTIRVRGQWSALSCTESSAVLGSAGFINAFRDFAGAPVAGTWYAIALANSLFGSDLDPSGDDINANFNSNLGTPGCLSSSGWYYGLDANPPGSQIDFVTVLLHELGHGLGFASLVNLSTGAKALGFNDAYMRHLENHGASPSDYPSMSDAQRVAASIATGNLHWTGANVRAASGVLSAGTVGDHVRMNAPNPQQPGSSVSHFDPALTPNQLMEPSYTVPIHTPVLELPLFRDLGWRQIPSARNFNGDTTSDITWRHSNGTAAMWLMNGSAISSAPTLGVVPTNWSVVGQRDFNGDGKHDWLWRNNTDGTVGMWLLNGGSIVAQSSFAVVPTTWTVTGTGDFNGDARGDILWRNSTGELGIWFMNGATVTSSANLGVVPTTWSVVETGDLNGDGKRDLVWRNSDGQLGLWLMDGATIAGSANYGVIPAVWTVAATGDFDGDGRSDILWRKTDDGTVNIWFMNGTTVTSSASLGTVPTTWTIAGTGDFNGDGKSDILWRNSDGLVGMWFMNGALLSSNATFGVVGGEWTIVATNAN